MSSRPIVRSFLVPEIMTHLEENEKDRRRVIPRGDLREVLLTSSSSNVPPR